MTKKYPCRCLGCWGRKSLRQKPKDYARQPKCTCGARHWTLDRYRMRKEMDARLGCNCDGYHFKHREGSGFCKYRKNAEEYARI